MSLFLVKTTNVTTEPELQSETVFEPFVFITLTELPEKVHAVFIRFLEFEDAAALSQLSWSGFRNFRSCTEYYTLTA